MFDDLVDFQPDTAPPADMTPVDKAAPAEILEAQLRTMDWLEELGVKDEDIAGELQVAAARKAFGALAVSIPPEEEQRCALLALKTPVAVRHLTGMLAAYDWEFVEQAKEIRGYVVAQLVEECKNPNASIRLKALTQLGKVTEIGLFTDKIEVKKTDVSDAELEQRIKDRLNKFMGVVDVISSISDSDTIDEAPRAATTPAE